MPLAGLQLMSITFQLSLAMLYVRITKHKFWHLRPVDAAIIAYLTSLPTAIWSAVIRQLKCPIRAHLCTSYQIEHDRHLCLAFNDRLSADWGDSRQRPSGTAWISSHEAVRLQTSGPLRHNENPTDAFSCISHPVSTEATLNDR